MNYLKMFCVILSVVSSLKSVILPLKPFSRSKVLELFGKIYDLLPNHPVTKEVFLQSVDKWLTLYVLIVNALWELNPELCHKLAWSVVKAEQSAWLSIVEQVQKYLKPYFTIDDEINNKANEYIHVYNLKVLDALLTKDFEVERKKFDEQCTESINREIEKLKAQMSTGEPDGEWLFYIDHSGIYINENKVKEVKSWTGMK